MRIALIIAILAVSALAIELKKAFRETVPQSMNNFAASLENHSDEFHATLQVMEDYNKDETISQFWPALKKRGPASFVKKAEEFVRELRAEVDAIDNEEAKKFVNQIMENDAEATTLLNIVVERDDYWRANAAYQKAENARVKAIYARYVALGDEAKKSVDRFSKFFGTLAPINE